ncbi:hypothetical protein SALBM135S_08540 [Streptomyces alboniger]
MLSCEAIPDAVGTSPGLIPFGRADARTVGAVGAVYGVGAVGEMAAVCAVCRFDALPGRRPPAGPLAVNCTVVPLYGSALYGSALYGSASDCSSPDADERGSAGRTDTRNAQPALGIAGLTTADAPRPAEGGERAAGTPAPDPTGLRSRCGGCGPMSRFLFVVPPLADHVTPASAVASELACRGPEVAWAGRPAAPHPGRQPRASRTSGGTPSSNRTRLPPCARSAVPRECR